MTGSNIRARRCQRVCLLVLVTAHSLAVSLALSRLGVVVGRSRVDRIRLIGGASGGG